MSGLFVVFEGGDGVGKTTQVDRLVRWLGETGHQVVRTHEPGDTALGRQIRTLILDPATETIDPETIDHRAEALLLAADKAQHLTEVVRPALAAGAVVVSDRYVDSLIAYQGAGREIGPAEVAELAEWATGGIRGDLTVLLDLAPAEAVDRKPDKDRLEDAGAEFHARVRAGFLACAEADPARYLVLPARDSPDDIEAAVRARVELLLGELSEVSGRIES
jgi:dTMP kinase